MANTYRLFLIPFLKKALFPVFVLKYSNIFSTSGDRHIGLQFHIFSVLPFSCFGMVLGSILEYDNKHLFHALEHRHMEIIQL